MAIPITIPRLGWDMEHGIFLGWLKPDGANVHAGDRLFTLESDKATEEIECLDDGILGVAPDGPKEGDKLPVGAVIGFVLSPGEKIPSSSSPSPVAGAASTPQIVTAPSATVAASKRAGPTISPRAKRVARELGVDWTRLTGSGCTGRIRERDVRAMSPTAASTGHLPVSTMRRTIAERMLASQRATAAVTLMTTADATNLVNLRQQAKLAVQAGNDLLPSYTDFLVKLTAFALQKHPLLNASWVDKDQIILSEQINIGIAVNLEDGLLVPVLRDVASLGLRQIAAQSRQLIERARKRQLKAEEMQHGTFTLTNLGAFGIDAFTPIIHHPQCAILGVGRIQKRPVVTGSPAAEQIAIREQISLSLTFDHRIVDGAPAAQFLQTLGRLIDNPGPWFIR